MLDVKVRYVTENISDYEIFRAMHESFSYVHEDEIEFLRKPIIKDYEQFKICAQNEEIFIATLREEVIGYVVALGYTDGVCKIKEIYVKPDKRRKGLGKKVVEQIAKVAQSEGFRKIQLNSVNMATDNFWYYCNFRPLNNSALYEFYF